MPLTDYFNTIYKSATSRLTQIKTIRSKKTTENEDDDKGRGRPPTASGFNPLIKQQYLAAFKASTTMKQPQYGA